MILFSLILLSTNAIAQQSLRSGTGMALEGRLGLGTPLGYGGIALEVAPVRYLVLSNGVGGSSFGTQLASMIYLRTSGVWAARLGAGFSSGRYVWANGEGEGCLLFGGCAARETSTMTRTWSRAVWANFEASIEAEHRYGLGFRAFGGVAVLGNPGDGTCRSLGVNYQGAPRPCDAPKDPPALLYVGAALRVSWLL